MSALADLSLLRPAWLLALPLLAGLALLLARRRRGLGGWERAVDPALLAAMRALGRSDEAGRPVAALMAVALSATVVLALSGPSSPLRGAISYRNLDGVVFVLDASPSAIENPAWAQLLTMGRVGVEALGSRPGGLIVFAGDAYVATDLSADRRELGQTLSVIDAATVPDPGTRPERGLALAGQMLDEGEILAGDVILLSDGGGLGPEAEAQARRIAERGARLSVVGPAGEDGAALAALALAGKGRAFGPLEAEALAGFLRQDSRERLAALGLPLPYRADHGRWLLLLALVAAGLLLRRRGGA